MNTRQVSKSVVDLLFQSLLSRSTACRFPCLRGSGVFNGLIDCLDETVKSIVFPVVEPLDVTQSDPEFRQLEVWYFALVQFDRYEVNAAWRFLRIDN